MTSAQKMARTMKHGRRKKAREKENAPDGSLRVLEHTTTSPRRGSGSERRIPDERNGTVQRSEAVVLREGGGECGSSRCGDGGGRGSRRGSGGSEGGDGGDGGNGGRDGSRSGDASEEETISFFSIGRDRKRRTRLG